MNEQLSLDVQTQEVPQAAELSPKELEEVRVIREGIDVSNAVSVMNYGAAAQGKLADFTTQALSNVRNKDLGSVGEDVTKLITELKNFDVDKEEKGIGAFFKKKANRLEEIKAQYAKVETNVNTIVGELEKHQVILMKDVDVLDRMYEMNLNYFKELTKYIIAGKEALNDARNTELVRLREEAEKTGLPEDAQKARDYAGMCDRFEKKLYDLELTRTVSLQTAPQIRMVQSSDTMMVEKIQSTIVNTIPLWKNQMLIAIGVDHAAEAARAEREVNDLTNALLRKNADKLKDATIAAAKESERGVVDIETLKHTNEQLISTLDEVLAIQRDGKEKRREAQQQLGEIEGQLKQKLLEASQQ